MEQNKIDFKTLAWDSPMNGARFKAYEKNGRRLRLVEFSKEFEEPDWCKNGHIGYVLEGEMDIDFNGNIVRFIPGDGIFIQPGEKNKHKATVITDIVKLVLVEDI